jgi:undecaprenyl-diphosphatase
VNIFDAVVYGTIQGLSEFLPVSSSGHLALLPHLMKLNDPGVVFDLMMHLGTAIAVSIYFRKRLLQFLKALKPSSLNFSQGHADVWFARNFIISTVVSVFFILLLMPLAKLARDPWVIVLNLSVFGVILWGADVINRKSNDLVEAPFSQRMQWRLAILIGAAQAIAIFPGVSRSGITLSVALLLGMRRKDAGEYSFLLSLPIIFAGILKEIPDLLKNQESTDFAVLLTGIMTSFIVGWFTIHFFMKLIGQMKLGYFTMYRLILAIVVYVVLL